MAQEDNFKINEAFVDELYNSAQSVVHNELKSHFLLGDTEEFDNFIPDSVELDSANAYDIFRLACCQYVGYRTEENENEAESNWLKASTMGDANAMLELSVCLFTELKYEEGFKCLMKSSKAGNQVASFRLALCYLNGIGCSEDTEKGTKLIKVLAQNNEPNSMYFYSTMLQYGTKDIEPDEVKANELLIKASELGSAFAKTDIGLRAFISAKTEEEKINAIKMVEEGADDGDIRAMCIMAIIYSRGEDGIEQNIEKAHEYLALSYDANFPIAVKIVESARELIKKATKK